MILTLITISILWIYALFIGLQFHQISQIRNSFEDARLATSRAIIAAYNCINLDSGEYTYMIRGKKIRVDVVRNKHDAQMQVYIENDNNPYSLYTKGQQLLVGIKE
ncbi:hypothetical protein [Mangrovibacillus cuniculi]|uniref:Uncharacterized protein n=1 Tax=Mangrovibacillus cuniculi TaxID=2593652 RepID=A0A7S8CBM2_9BACI|nr:hypothetical protein [Mangrovibacillus cuniculi]QPC46856.1 hypothetical protein G8O30_07725 [Mangrovibacillus cuniculi]